MTIALESHVARLQASISTIAHQERPEYLDRLSVLREQIFTLDHMYMSVFSTAGWILRLAVTVVLLATVNPVLILLVFFAIPTVAATSWRPVVERTAQERGAQADRLARHLFTLTTTASPGKELRVLGIGLTGWPTAAGPPGSSGTARWQRHGRGHRPGMPPAGRSSALATSARLPSRRPGRPRLGDRRHPGPDGGRPAVVVCRRHGGRDRLPARHLDGRVTPARVARELRRQRWPATPTCPHPTRITDGIRFEHVTFGYPGTTSRALDDVDLFLPAGAVVAIVGENGAGKTTLVKLLAKLYHPSSGRILIDGTDLAHIDPEQWRERLAGAFQDFFRFEFQAGQTIGLGDLPRLDSEPALVAALDRAGARDVVDALPAGLERSSGRPGTRASTSPTASGRSWRSPAASCATSR